MRNTTRISLILLCLQLILMGTASAQKRADQDLLQKLLLKQNDSLMQAILQDPQKYHLQVIYTQIDRNRHNKPYFTSYTLGLDSARYFYPASTVKLATAAVALEKLNKLKKTGITKYTSFSIDSAYARQTSVASDSSSASGLPSVGHYIKKIFLVSDNDAYNRLYEFIGQQQLNNALHQKGYKEVRLLHRLSVGDGGERSRYTNPVTFFDDKGIVLYQQPLVYNPAVYPNKLKTTSIGNGYYSNGELIKQPMDFSEKNYMSLSSLQSILKSIVLPEGVAPQQRFDLTEEDYAFLYEYMSMLPRESQHPAYNVKEYPDSYAKFLIFGGQQERLPEHIRVFNKVGDAYGYLIDNAYVVDFDNKVEFLLSAVILANDKMIFNSDDYQYETVALPFMKKLGQAVYELELKRRRKYKPKLNKFMVDYTKE